MQLNHRPKKILVVGKSGSGKSTYQIRYVKNAPYDRIFIFDHKMEFRERLGIEPVFDAQEIAEKLEQNNNRGIYSFNHSEIFPGNSEAGFQFFSDWVFNVCKALCADGLKSLFVVDEVNRFTNTSDLGYEFKQLIEDGRLQGLDFIGTSHASNQIHNRLALQLDEIVAFRTIGKRPLQFLEDEDFDILAVRNLPIGAFILKDMDSGSFRPGKLFSTPQNDTLTEGEPQEPDPQENPEPEKEVDETPH